MNWIFSTLAAESQAKECLKINIFLVNCKTLIYLKKIIALQCLYLWRLSFKDGCLVKRDSFTETRKKYTISEKQPFVAFWIQWINDFFFFLKIQKSSELFFQSCYPIDYKDMDLPTIMQNEKILKFNWNEIVVYSMINWVLVVSPVECFWKILIALSFLVLWIRRIVWWLFMWKTISILRLFKIFYPDGYDK